MSRIKHPGFRVADIVDVLPSFREAFYSDMLYWASLTPFKDLITDIEIVGSYARGRAELHSDIDVNIATSNEQERLTALSMIGSNIEQWSKAVYYLRTLWNKYGLMIQIQLQHPTVKDVSYKMCYSLGERKSYGHERRRMDKEFGTGIVRERVRIKLREPRLNLTVKDEGGNDIDFIPEMHDPWLNELPFWENAYKKKLLRYGESSETVHMKRKA